MKKVKGVVSYDVLVYCPHCQQGLQLNQYPYPDQDGYDVLGDIVFGGRDKPAKCENLKMGYECSHCREHFILSGLEY